MRRILFKPQQANALKFAIIVGSLLFTLNHGSTVVKGKMTAQRWFSSVLSFVVPYLTSVYCPCA